MDINGLDTFSLITYQNLDLDERNVLTLLYQPILGSDAFTLYLTLWSLIERARLKSPEYRHYILYDTLRMSPTAFQKARQKLEAIGLVVAYHNEETYLYELKAPLSAEEFIKDGSLGAYLFSRVGQDVFEQLSSLFRVSRPEKAGFTNITSTFDKVFDSLPKPIHVNDQYVSKAKAKLTIEHSFDFEIFLEGLSKNFVDKRKLTRLIKEKIMNIAYVYDLDEFTMQKVFMDSVDKDRNIDIELLSENAKKWFDFERETIQQEPQENLNEDIAYTDIIRACKTEKPTTILSILSNGKPSVQELNVVEKLIDHYDLEESVINFMLVYVIGQLEEFPSYNYFDKVAVEWQRNRVQTIDDALKVIKKRTQKHQQSKPKQKGSLPKDVEPDWFDEYMKNR
jgi:replication initiation and membrane attachment protein